MPPSGQKEDRKFSWASGLRWRQQQGQWAARLCAGVVEVEILCFLSLVLFFSNSLPPSTFELAQGRLPMPDAGEGG